MNIEQSATKLSRNPLGIIALFILLIYGLATALFGYVGSSLTENQKWWFVIFLVVFPIIVLASFVYLVVKHHPKLYAPGDFRDENNFFGYQSPKELAEKYENETSCFFGYVDPPNVAEKSKCKKTEPVVEERRKAQSKQSAHEEAIVVCKKAEELKPLERLSLENVEKLVIGHYERTRNIEIEKHVYFMVNKRKVCFDGFLETKDGLNFYQVFHLPKDIAFDDRALESVKNCIKGLASDVLSVKEYMLNSGKYPNYRYRLKILVALDTESLSEKMRIVNKIRNVVEIESLPVIIKGFRIPVLERAAKIREKPNNDVLEE